MATELVGLEEAMLYRLRHGRVLGPSFHGRQQARKAHCVGTTSAHEAAFHVEQPSAAEMMCEACW